MDGSLKELHDRLLQSKGWIRVTKYSKYNPAPRSVRNKRFNDRVKSKCTMFSRSGVFVQSMGEKLIADYLFDNNINFDYDKLIVFSEDPYLCARPDFLIKGTKIIIEYWGMNRSLGTYDEKMKRKKALYKQEGFELIGIYAEQLQVLKRLLDQKILNKVSKENIIYN